MLSTDRYLAHIKLDSSTPQNDTSRGHSPNDMGFSSDVNSHGDHIPVKDEMGRSSELIGQDDSDIDGFKRSLSSISALKELVRATNLSPLKLHFAPCLFLRIDGLILTLFL